MFKIDLSGILLELNIRDYNVSESEDLDDHWCKVDFSFSSEEWLNYRKENYEVITSREIETLANSIEMLLKNELNDICSICLIEPDFSFKLYPSIYMEWSVSFWNHGLTDNFLSVTLYRDDLEYIVTYLNYVMGKLSSSNPKVLSLVREGFLEL